MGVFDMVTVEDLRILPNLTEEERQKLKANTWQSKELGGEMKFYTITPKGQLKMEGEDEELTKEIFIYTIRENEKGCNTWYEFYLKFLDGQLLEAGRILPFQEN